MSLDVSALTTLSTVKDELGISSTSDDSTLERYITQATSLFERVTGRKWFEKTDHEERVEGYNAKRLTVTEHIPIDSITKIELKTATGKDEVDSTSYEIEDAEAGFIRKRTGSWRLTEAFERTIEPTFNQENLNLYVVTYTGGYVTPEQADQTGKTRTLPENIEAAVISQVTKMYRDKGKNPKIKSESIMSVSIDYADFTDTQGMLPGVTPMFDQVASAYRVPGVAIA